VRESHFSNIHYLYIVIYMLLYIDVFLEFIFCRVIGGILCIDCSITLKVLQICCITVMCNVKKISPLKLIIL